MKVKLEEKIKHLRRRGAHF